MSKRIMLTVAYDGTGYAGFQRQKLDPHTIEGELDRALRALTGEEIEVIGASRTDAGVHARANIAVFDTDSSIPADKLCRAVNRFLPDSIRVQKSCEVPQDFHPRHCSAVKTYEYTIYNAETPDPVRRLYSCYSFGRFDTARMQEAAQYLAGTHDFTSFCSLYSQAETRVRTILEIGVETGAERLPREIVIRVRGTGFLYHMVRIIAGTLMEVGRGRLAPEEMAEILEARDRRKAGPTAPACGLVLADFEFADGNPERV